jgi:hypothetical protein
MEIVTTSYLLKIFSNIDLFTLDLGSNLTGKVAEPGKGEEIKIKISDEFIKRYEKNTGRFIYKYGNIGKLKFYNDPFLQRLEIQVHVNENLIYELEVNEGSLKENPRKYLSKLLENLTKTTKESTDEPVEELNEEYHLLHITNVPEDVEKPKIDLPKDEYIEQMVKRRNLLTPLSDSPEISSYINKKRQKNIEQNGYS